MIMWIFFYLVFYLGLGRLSHAILIDSRNGLKPGFVARSLAVELS